jgi:phage/plasmid primase-like uncharacterized protein
MDPVELFRDAMLKARIEPPAKIIADGVLHRFPTGKSKRDDAGYYVLHLDGIPAGVFGCWRQSVEHKWCGKEDGSISEERRAEFVAKIQEAKAQREAELKELQAATRIKAKALWKSATPLPIDYPYLVKKNIQSHGARFDGRRMLVPVTDGKEIWSIQYIDSAGKKLFLKGGRVKRRFFLIGEPRGRIFIAEGFATAATILQETGDAVAVVFNAGNILPALRALRRQYRKIEFVICADDDWKTPGNTGLRKAKKAALKFDLKLAIPEFGDNRGDNDSDFNDMAALVGPEKVRECLLNAAKVRPPADDDDDGKKQPKQADILIGLALGYVKLFHTADGVAYADIPINGHRETWALRTKGFKNWLSLRYYQETKGAPSSEALNSALAVLDAEAQFNSTLKEVYVRVAGNGDRIYLDLGDEHWSAIEVDADGWRLCQDPPVRFRRPRGILPLPLPMKGGSVLDLRSFLNVKTENDFVLVVSWLLAALRDKGPYPIIALAGVQGSAKSTLMKLLRALIDPHTLALRSLPKDDRDLFISANNTWILAYDNVSHLSQTVSDGLCKLSTGGGHGTRQLFTDQDEAIFSAQRPILLNGIEDVVVMPDLADRSIFLTLEEIPNKDRKLEKRLWGDFDAKVPSILGGLLDALAHGLKELSTTELEDLPRLADFAVWATACETSIWEPGTFLRAYRENLDEAVGAIVEANLVATAVVRFMDDKARWEGEASELLSALNAQDEARTRQKGWPPQPNVLSGRLRRAAPVLKKLGIIVTRGERDTTKKRSRKITLEVVREEKNEEGRLADYKRQTSSASSTSSAANDFKGLQRTISEMTSSANARRPSDVPRDEDVADDLGPSSDDLDFETVRQNPLTDNDFGRSDASDGLFRLQSARASREVDEELSVPGEPHNQSERTPANGSAVGKRSSASSTSSAGSEINGVHRTVPELSSSNGATRPSDGVTLHMRQVLTRTVKCSPEFVEKLTPEQAWGLIDTLPAEMGLDHDDEQYLIECHRWDRAKLRAATTGEARQFILEHPKPAPSIGPRPAFVSGPR